MFLHNNQQVMNTTINMTPNCGWHVVRHVFLRFSCHKFEKHQVNELKWLTIPGPTLKTMTRQIKQEVTDNFCISRVGLETFRNALEVRPVFAGL